MPIEICLMPAGAGKTELALQRLSAVIDAQPFARVWVLVSGRRQQDAFRQRLLERDDHSVYFNIEFFNFYQLYHRLLNIARQPPRKLDTAARFGLLRAVLAQLKAEGKLRVYGGIADTPGFIRLVAEFIYELKQNLITHEQLSAAAHSDKDHDLARIYSVYQQRLVDKNLVDREGEGWLALALLSRPEHELIGRDVELLLVDGYDQFTPLQARLLLLLAGRTHQSLITLPVFPGAGSAGSRFERTLAGLQAAAGDTPLTINRRLETLPAVAARRHADLQHVCQHLFQPAGAAAPAGEGVRLIEAPDIRREVSAVLRRVRRLLVDGCQPDDILIALRDWPRYAPHFARLGAEYGLPLALHGGLPLAHNPAVVMLLHLLDLHAGDFRRRDLLDVLRSPYFAVPGLDKAQANHLEQISQQFLVLGGRAAWLEAVDRAAWASQFDEDEDAEAGAALLSAPEADALRTGLSAFFEQVTPPERAPLPAYVRWLEALIGQDIEANPDDNPAPADASYNLNMPGCIRAGGDEVAGRDIAAMQAFKRVLRGLLSAHALLAALSENLIVDRQTFRQALQSALDGEAVEGAPLRTGRVLVTTVTDARGLPHAHVFIPGLAEGIFPAPVVEDPLYLDGERRALQARGIALEPRAARAGDEGLFYELVSLAGQSLTLSRPTVQDGAPWAASHVWRAVQRLFQDPVSITERIRVGGVAGPDEVASPGEALLAAADALARRTWAQPALYNWLLDHHRDTWLRVNQARRVELSRMAHDRQMDAYSGRLRQPALIAQVAQMLGAGRQWSASQLNDYGLCPFRFFAKRLLRLEAVKEPEAGLDVPGLGTIVHEILERTYAAVQRDGLAIDPQHCDQALAILEAQADAVLADAPRRLGFKENALWSQESAGVRRRLRALVELDFSGDSPLDKHLPGRVPYRQEANFGGRDAPQVIVPVTIDGQPETLRLRGVIDRIDRAGDRALVVDYKDNSGQIPLQELRDGRNFQMLIYLYAAKAVLQADDPSGAPPQLLGGLFWHIRSRKTSGELLLSDGAHAALAARAVEQISANISAGRRGDFSVKPSKLAEQRCAHYCDYARFCRVSIASQHKPGAGHEHEPDG
jgi:ATP-dependent helicase/nuclease subunit B